MATCNKKYCIKTSLTILFHMMNILCSLTAAAAAVAVISAPSHWKEKEENQKLSIYQWLLAANAACAIYSSLAKLTAFISAGLNDWERRTFSGIIVTLEPLNIASIALTSYLFPNQLAMQKTTVAISAFWGALTTGFFLRRDCNTRYSDNLRDDDIALNTRGMPLLP